MKSRWVKDDVLLCVQWPCVCLVSKVVWMYLVLCLWSRLLIAFIHDRSQMVWRGYLYTVLLFVVAFVQSMMLHQYFHRCMVVGMRIRSALVAAVYKKVGLSDYLLLQTFISHVVSLFSNDCCLVWKCHPIKVAVRLNLYRLFLSVCLIHRISLRYCVLRIFLAWQMCIGDTKMGWEMDSTLCSASGV